MDVDEFRRRIEVYLDQEASDLGDERTRISEVLARRLWPLVDGWQRQMKSSQETVEWLAARLQEDWPDVARRLSMEQSGSEDGWLANVRRPLVQGECDP